MDADRAPQLKAGVMRRTCMVLKMRNILFISLSIFICPGSTYCPPTQSKAIDCPLISVACPDADPKSHAPIVFAVAIRGGKELRPLSYCWRVSSGKIKKGQGTASIEVDGGGSDQEEGITATVDVSGFEGKCAHVASCSTAIRAQTFATHNNGLQRTRR